MRKALVLSFAVHALGLVLARPVAHALELTDAKDRWTGATADLPANDAVTMGTTSATIDIGLEPTREVSPPEPAPKAPSPTDSVPAAPAAPRAPQEAPSSTSPASSANTPSSARPLAAKPHVRREGPGRSGGGKSARGGGDSGPFGAEGPPSPRDIGYAFTRAIPPANDSELGWASVAKGSVGKLEVAIHIDETGHIGSVEPTGRGRPAPLLGLLKRTLPMLRAGTFEVRSGSVAEGTEILEIEAVVRGPDADSSPEGEVAGRSDALAFHYARGRGDAHFKIPSGERVDVSIRVVRVEPR